jgi:hypothetical protein
MSEENSFQHGGHLNEHAIRMVEDIPNPEVTNSNADLPVRTFSFTAKSNAALVHGSTVNIVNGIRRGDA